jgi:endonuclease YncB( thermonuclease family)
MKFRSFCGLLVFAAVLGWVAWWSTSFTEADFANDSGCHWSGSGEAFAWRHIHDGDTLTLTDGRRVRVIGLNAPEVARSGHGGEPFANEATIAARNFLRDSGKVVIQPGAEDRDRHGRLLAHVFRPEDGASLASNLLAQGLAWQIAVPPNLGYLDCNRAAENEARTQGLGLWSSQYRGSEQATTLESGFRVLSATIDRVAFNKSWWLETDAGFVLRIPNADRSMFERSAIERLPGQRVEVRGWMYRRTVEAPFSPWVLLLRHPSALELLH